MLPYEPGRWSNRTIITDCDQTNTLGQMFIDDVIAVEAFKLWNFFSAWTTPGRPEMNDGSRSEQRSQIGRLCVDPGHDIWL